MAEETAVKVVEVEAVEPVGVNAALIAEACDKLALTTMQPLGGMGSHVFSLLHSPAVADVVTGIVTSREIFDERVGEEVEKILQHSNFVTTDDFDPDDVINQRDLERATENLISRDDIDPDDVLTKDDLDPDDVLMKKDFDPDDYIKVNDYPDESELPRHEDLEIYITKVDHEKNLEDMFKLLPERLVSSENLADQLNLLKVEIRAELLREQKTNNGLLASKGDLTRVERLIPSGGFWQRLRWLFAGPKATNT